MATGSRPEVRAKVASLPTAGRSHEVPLPRHSPRQNHLLSALPAADYERIAAHLELASLKLGDVLYEPGVRLRYVYFPTTAIVRESYERIVGQ